MEYIYIYILATYMKGLAKKNAMWQCHSQISWIQSLKIGTECYMTNYIQKLDWMHP